MNVFVIKSLVKDVSFTTIFKGVIPFVITDLIRLLILIAFPMIALYLPQRMGQSKYRIDTGISLPFTHANSP